MLNVFLIFSLLTVNIAQAEYRVFILRLENNKTQSIRQIQTTLDPEQYATLFPLSSEETLTYVDTWKCLGRTDYLRPHCDRPEKPITQRLNVLDRNPASFPSQSPELK